MTVTEIVRPYPDMLQIMERQGQSPALTIPEMQAEVLDWAATVCDESIPVKDKVGMRADIEKNIGIIGEYLSEADEDMVISLSKREAQRPNARLGLLMHEYGDAQERSLVVPRRFITGIVLGALWGGDNDCVPVADMRIVVPGKDPDLSVFGKPPTPSYGNWSRFSLGQLAL